MTTSDEIKAEYTSSLADLTCNSKPLINVLTMLAEENIQNAKDIVEAIETHLSKVSTEVKLPILYLIDCIVKNIGGTYSTLFSQNIVLTFVNVFKLICARYISSYPATRKVDEKTRAEMFKLRQTWNDVFSHMKLYALDVQIHGLDPAWPVTAKRSAKVPPTSIYFNPKFLKPTSSASAKTEKVATMTPYNNININNMKMQQQLLQKQKELIALEQKKLELEVLQTQVKLQGTAALDRPNILLKPEVAKQLTPSSSVKKPAGISAAAVGSKPRINPVNSALATAAKPTRDPRLLRQQKLASTVTNSDQFDIPTKAAVLVSHNNNVNKMGIRENSRNEPRSIINKDDSSLSQKTDTTKHNKNTTTSKSRSLSDSHKSPTKSSRTSSKSNDDNKSSKSSLSSPSKNKSDSKSKSPNSRHKKKDDLSNNKKSLGSKDIKRLDKPHKSDIAPTAFKGVKISKIRNYVRRNLSPPSPERVEDEDLRYFAPPEKQPRLQADSIEDKNSDIDLRHLSTSGNKKRLSTDSPDNGSSKKSKTEVFDELFGNEDMDLRQITGLPGVGKIKDRPPTPPPPIISLEPTPAPKVLSNLDAVRAKLANATNRDKILAKSFNKKKINELKVSTTTPASTTSDKIIITPDDEQSIKLGTMSEERGKHLLNRLMAQDEKQKLREAKKKDHEESFCNITLQPISDEELQDEFAGDNSMDRRLLPRFGDKDDRVAAANNMGMQQNDDGFNYNNRSSGRMPAWRGRRRPMGGGPMMFPQPPVRGRPPFQQQWRKMGGANNFNNEFNEEDGSRSPEGPQELVVDSVNQDDIKTMIIDNAPRDIRYYDDGAIVFLRWDDPRDISFQSGERRVTFNENDNYTLEFNAMNKEVLVNGSFVKVRLGAPSREIFINDKPYECYFGGLGITIDLNGKNTAVKLEGPPPPVTIGTIKRTDLVAGKVNLIVNAKTVFRVFLDAKLQKFVVDGETVTLKFVDALKTVLINDVPFNVEFGGLPKPISIHDKKHFIRFSVLPKGVRPGYVCIKDMSGCRQPDLSPRFDGNSQDAMDCHESTSRSNRTKKLAEFSPERNSNSPHFFQNLNNLNNLDEFSNAILPNLPQTSAGGYQVAIQADSQPETLPSITSLPKSLNINELFQKLVATGIVSTDKNIVPVPVPKPVVPTSQPPQPQAPKAIPKKLKTHHKHTPPAPKITPQPVPPPQVPPHNRKSPIEHLKPVLFRKPETLRVRQAKLYDILYSGMQCSSCGMRFPPELSMHYSQHLDWHFRQNRKGKKNIRVAASRRWYYSISDWKNYEEIEDLEEREKNFFDQQMSQAEGNGEDAEEEVEIPSVAADPDVADGQCEVCHDQFDQFFNEEKEEWHLRNAIRVEEKVYHPLCYDDYQLSLLEQSKREEESKKEEPEPEIKPPTEMTIPGLEIIVDDDEEEEKPKETTEVVIEESDESKPMNEESSQSAVEEKPAEAGDEEDDDVILNEVAPVKIVLDDDDDEMKTIADTDDSFAMKKEQSEIDDGFVDVGEGMLTLPTVEPVVIKAEPTDSLMLDIDASGFVDIPEKEPSELKVVEPVAPMIKRTGLVSSMDGNVEMDSAAASSVGGRIKINISKPMPVIAPVAAPKEVAAAPIEYHMDTMVDANQPLPPGEEPPMLLHMKPALKGLELKKLPAVNKGNELSGLCSIM